MPKTVAKFAPAARRAEILAFLKPAHALPPPAAPATQKRTTPLHLRRLLVILKKRVTQIVGP